MLSVMESTGLETFRINNPLFMSRVKPAIVGLVVSPRMAVACRAFTGMMGAKAMPEASVIVRLVTEMYVLLFMVPIPGIRKRVKRSEGSSTRLRDVKFTGVAEPPLRVTLTFAGNWELWMVICVALNGLMLIVSENCSVRTPTLRSKMNATSDGEVVSFISRDIRTTDAVRPFFARSSTAF